MPLTRWKTAILCLVLLAGCSDPTGQGGAGLPDKAAPPHLVPLEGILAQADALGDGKAATGSVSARAAALRNKAARLRKQ
jgi:hypothetical protein